MKYTDAGVDIEAANRAKKAMGKSVKGIGAFAAVVEAPIKKYKNPVLIFKMEEPGSKQLLAATWNMLPSVCEDMVNHLINDIIVMGATPLAVQDVIVCGKLEPSVVTNIVAAISKACRKQGCELVGGETSEQPGVIPTGTYILAASVIGVAEKSGIIDGTKMRLGDVVLAIESNGLHTNGYSLVRKLLAKEPGLLQKKVGKETFKRALMRPHFCYYKALKGLFNDPGLRGMAHITGGGIPGNLVRILPKNVNAEIELRSINILPIFKFIKEEARMPDPDMIRTFNLGVGMTLVAEKNVAHEIQQHVERHRLHCYPIGRIVRGSGKVMMNGKLTW
jgi:phosphoribosylformylglycinamidine cyclo-ligase